MAEAKTSSDHWEKKVLLLFADDIQNLKMQEQLEILKSAREELQKQDVQVYLVFSDTVTDLDGNKLPHLNPAKIRTDFSVRPDEFRLILLGKKGTVAANGSFSLDRDTLLAKIHALGESGREK